MATKAADYVTRRITTVRHGRPALARDARMSWRDYGDWWAEYERTGLHAEERPPQALIEIAKSSPILISSPRPRAIETARLAADGREDIPAEELFAEMPLPAPPLPWARLKPGLWGVVSRTYWFLGYASGGESHAAGWRRIARARDALIARAAEGDIFLCAHGYFNFMLDIALRRRGWRRLHDGGSNYWAWRVYEGRVPASAATSASAEEAPTERRAAE